jgi:hypothetical protein
MRMEGNTRGDIWRAAEAESAAAARLIHVILAVGGAVWTAGLLVDFICRGSPVAFVPLTLFAFATALHARRAQWIPGTSLPLFGGGGR